MTYTPTDATRDIYGWFDPADPGRIAHDPPHNAACPYCGEPLTDSDVRTHYFLPAEGTFGIDTTYFYRTHRTCDTAAPSNIRDAIFSAMVERMHADGALDV